MSKILSRLFSAGWWSSEIAMLVWLYSYIADVGLLGALRGFALHTLGLWIGFSLLMLLKRRAETHAWPRWAVKVLRLVFVPSYAYDCWFNTRYGTLVFLEFPPARVLHKWGLKLKHRFEPFTERLKRHYRKAGWRGNLARLFCWLAHLVDKGHCL